MDSRELDEPSALRWMAGRKAEFLVEAIVAVLDGWEKD